MISTTPLRAEYVLPDGGELRVVCVAELVEIRLRYGCREIVRKMTPEQWALWLKEEVGPLAQGRNEGEVMATNIDSERVDQLEQELADALVETDRLDEKLSGYAKGFTAANEIANVLAREEDWGGDELAEIAEILVRHGFAHSHPETGLLAFGPAPS